MPNAPSLNILVTLLFAYALGWVSCPVFSSHTNHTSDDYGYDEPTHYGVFVKAFLTTIIITTLFLFTKNIEQDMEERYTTPPFPAKDLNSKPILRRKQPIIDEEADDKKNSDWWGPAS
jgi:hypothetical protein